MLCAILLHFVVSYLNAQACFALTPLEKKTRFYQQMTTNATEHAWGLTLHNVVCVFGGESIKDYYNVLLRQTLSSSRHAAWNARSLQHLLLTWSHTATSGCVLCFSTASWKQDAAKEEKLQRTKETKANIDQFLIQSADGRCVFGWDCARWIWPLQCGPSPAVSGISPHSYRRERSGRASAGKDRSI